MTFKCYWIAGLSATGKTTLSTLLGNHLRSTGKKIILLDVARRATHQFIKDLSNATLYQNGDPKDFERWFLKKEKIN